MTVILDPVQEAQMVERFGEVVAATRVAYVDVTSGSVFHVALATPGVPQPGESLNLSSPDVKVVDRITTIAGHTGSNTKVRIEIHYELQRPETDDFALRGGATLNQVKTQVDGTGSPIEVTYQSETIRAEIDVLVPQANFRREIVEVTDDPEALVADFLGHVNSNVWKGGDPKQWLCTSVQYELVDKVAIPKRYQFEYEFEKADKPTGWVYTVVFKDKDGNIPDDIINGSGIKDIDWHPSKDFSTKFA